MLLDEYLENPIVVSAYSSRYLKAVRHVLGIEGGFVDDRADRGGATKYGISLRFLVSEGRIDLDGDGHADFDLDMDGDIDGNDIRRLTKGDAIWLYHRCFWLRLECEDFPPPLGEMMLDQGINGGLSAARRLLQQAINRCIDHDQTTLRAPVAEDGRIGPETRAALDWVIKRPVLGMPALVVAYREAAKDRYRAIARARPSQYRFLRGWLARADRLGRL
ncbi:MAG: glycosyl hydrolase 108 family protein [Blastomonas sp.]